MKCSFSHRKENNYDPKLQQSEHEDKLNNAFWCKIKWKTFAVAVAMCMFLQTHRDSVSSLLSFVTASLMSQLRSQCCIVSKICLKTMFFLNSVIGFGQIETCYGPVLNRSPYVWLPRFSVSCTVQIYGISIPQKILFSFISFCLNTGLKLRDFLCFVFFKSQIKYTVMFYLVHLDEEETTLPFPNSSSPMFLFLFPHSCSGIVSLLIVACWLSWWGLSCCQNCFTMFRLGLKACHIQK